MVKLIIYDLDGTLIDSRHDIANAVNGTLTELGLAELSVEQISSFVGNGVTPLMRRALWEAGAQHAVPLLERSIKLFRCRYSEHLLDNTRLYPSVPGVLEFFRQREQAVVTNKPEEFSLAILKGLGIDSYFLRIIGGDCGFPKKPDPGAVLTLMHQGGILPGETLLVGDSAMDVETGKNASVYTAAVTYGFGSRAEIENSHPHFLLDDLAELTQLSL